MLNNVERLPGSDIGAYVRPAKVIGIADDGQVLVEFHIDANSYRIPVHSASHIGTVPGPGKRVLVAGEDLSHGYIIAVLEPLADAKASVGYLRQRRRCIGSIDSF